MFYICRYIYNSNTITITIHSTYVLHFLSFDTFLQTIFSPYNSKCFIPLIPFAILYHFTSCSLTSIFFPFTWSLFGKEMQFVMLGRNCKPPKTFEGQKMRSQLSCFKQTSPTIALSPAMFVCLICLEIMRVTSPCEWAYTIEIITLKWTHEHIGDMNYSRHFWPITRANSTALWHWRNKVCAFTNPLI